MTASPGSLLWFIETFLMWLGLFLGVGLTAALIFAHVCFAAARQADPDWDIKFRRDGWEHLDPE